MMKKSLCLLLCLIIFTTIYIPNVEASDKVSATTIVNNAKSLVGKYPYVWGGKSPEEGGFDCSGLVWYVYNQMSGVNITLEQAGRSKSALANAGTKIIGISNFLPGDIVQFDYAHVAIYIGNNTIIESPGTGQYVKYTTIDLNSQVAYAIRLSSVSQETEAEIVDSPTLSVQVGTTGSNTIFSWNNVAGAGSYNLKIWKDSYFEGDAYINKINVLSGTAISLPAGQYYAYIDAVNSAMTDWKMSNIVSFKIVELTSPALSVKIDTTGSNAIFSWNNVAGASTYNLKIWKDSYLEGNAYINKINVPSGTAISLPAGQYYAYIDAVNFAMTDWKMSNIVSFSIMPSYVVNFDNSDGTLDAEHKAIYFTDFVNVARGPDCMVICNEGKTTGHNDYGVEAIVTSDLKVVEIIDYVGNASIPEGGFVISGHGTARKWILDNINVGDYAFFNSYLGKITIWTENQMLLRGKKVTYGATYGKLPVPLERDGYTFKGWYTFKTGGELVTSETKVTITDNITLYPRWEAKIPHIESNVTKSGSKFLVDTKVYDFTAPYNILIIGYKGNRLVTAKQVAHDEQNSPYTLEGDIDKIKVMVWSNLSTLKPLCEAEEITSDNFIIE